MSITINAIATDDIINAAEAGTAITGTNTTGATVTLSIGGTNRTATVTGTTWSYTLVAADITNMGQGAETITATATVAGAAVAPHDITVDTIAPAATAAITAVADNVGTITGNLTSGGVTDDTALALSGTISAALTGTDVVAVYDGAVKLGNATVSGTTWTFTDNTLANGNAVSYRVRVEDLAGNTPTAYSSAFTTTIDTVVPATTATVSNVYDDFAPQTGNVAKGGTSNDTTPRIDGTTTTAAGEIIHVYRVDVLAGTTVEIGSVVSGGTGVWTFTDTSGGLVSGNAYRYQARVGDAAGNIGATDSAYNVISDSVAAAPVVTGVTNDLGVSATDGTTSDTTLYINGTGDPGATVTVYKAGTSIGTVVADSIGNWTFNHTGTALTNGTTYLFTARQTDLAGNVSAISAAFSVEIDTTAPTTTTLITAVTDNIGTIQGALTSGGVTDDTALVLTGTISAALGSDANGSYMVAVYDGTTRLGSATVVGTNWTYTDTTLDHGDVVSYTARVEDVAGNGVLSTAFTTTIDIMPSEETTTIVVTDNVGSIQGDLVALGRNGTDDTTLVLSGTLSGLLATGEVVAVYNGATKLGNASVTITDIYFGGFLVDQVATWTFNDIARAHGTTQNYAVYMEDTAGNQSPPLTVPAITVDTVAPTATAAITGITDDVAPKTGNVANGGRSNDLTPLIGGTVSVALDVGDYVYVYRDGVYQGNATVVGTNWTFADTLLTVGTYSYTAKVQDVAGNATALSAAYSISIDITPPELTNDNHSSTTSIAYTFSDSMDGTSVPATTNFVYELNGNAVMLNPTAVGIAGAVVTLTLASALTDVVEITYTPSGTPLLDGAGNAISTFHLISGGSGANTIGATYTGAGLNDIIWGGGGADTIDGGSGNDIFAYNLMTDFVASNAVVDSVTGGADTTGDKIQVAGAITLAAADSLARVNTVEQLVAAASTANLAHSIVLNSNANLGSITTIDLTANTGATSTGVITLTGVTTAVTLKGVSTGNNTLTGGTGADSITGGAGNDSITGGAGIDTLTGGTGNDIFAYATLAEFVTAGAVIDTVTGGADTTGDKIQVAGVITLTTTDSLARVNTVEQLVAATATAALAHSIVLDTDAKLGSITTIDLSGNTSTSASTINLTGVTTDMTLKGTSGNGQNIITGGSGNDSITGGSGNDSLTGNGGNDTFNFAAGILTSVDTVNGGLDSDTVALTGNTAIAATNFNNVSNIEAITLQNTTTNVAITTQDILVAAAATLTLNASSLTSGVLTFNGSSELDASFNIIGGGAADNITGGTGTDTLMGGLGVDVLVGGTGNDTYAYNTIGEFLSGTAVIDNITDGAADTGDRIQVAGNITITSAHNLSGAVGVEQLVAATQSTVNNTHSIVIPVKANQGTIRTYDLSGDTAAGSTATINIDQGNPLVITGVGVGTNNLTGGTVADSITGGAGNDTITGGDGIDTLTGGGGNDTFVFALWTDFYKSTAVYDTIDGGAGTDKILVANAMALGTTDTLATSMVGVEQLVAATATANLAHSIVLNTDAKLGSITTIDLSGNTSTSTSTINLTGVSTAMTLIGTSGTGANNITGGTGADTITGGNGTDDSITGGTGADVINLAETTAAIDTVVIAAGGSGVAGVDKINGFAAIATNGDRLNLPDTAIATTASMTSTDVSGILSHSVTSGMISFDDAATYAAPIVVNAGNLAAVTAYCAWNVDIGGSWPNPSETVAFYVDGTGNGTYGDVGDYLRVFQAGTTGAGSASTDDIYVDIYTLGVTSLGTTAAANRVVIV